MDQKTYKLIILDADGTLRRCTVPGQPCPNEPGQWELIPGVRERLAEIDWTTTRFAIASNQGGIALGYLTHQMARSLLEDMAIAIWGKPIRGPIWLCPHAPDAGCKCRKPQPGMLLSSCALLGIDPKDALMVGDQASDQQAAANAGIDYQDAAQFFGRA